MKSFFVNVDVRHPFGEELQDLAFAGRQDVLGAPGVKTNSAISPGSTNALSCGDLLDRPQ